MTNHYHSTNVLRKRVRSHEKHAQRGKLLDILSAAKRGTVMLDELIHDQLGVTERPEGLPPRYTTSLDDALLLRPEGVIWRGGTMGTHGPEALMREGTGYGGPRDYIAEGATVPLAICIAALMARWQMNN